jgi:hypothetical protein
MFFRPPHAAPFNRHSQLLALKKAEITGEMCGKPVSKIH